MDAATKPEVIFVEVERGLKVRIKTDAAQRGQSLRAWIERAAINRLEQVDENAEGHK